MIEYNHDVKLGFASSEAERLESNEGCWGDRETIEYAITGLEAGLRLFVSELDFFIADLIEAKKVKSLADLECIEDLLFDLWETLIG